MAQMKLVVTFQHNTRVVNSYFLSAEVKRENGFEHSGCGEAIWYTTENNQFIFVPVYNTSTLHEMQEFYCDEIVQQLDEIGDSVYESKSYLAFEGSDYGYCFVTQSNGVVSVYHWKIVS